MSLIANEQTKLTATALNTAASSCFALGVLAPIAAVFYNAGGDVHVPLAVLVLGAILWIGAALALHLSARLVLKGLKS
ncbi:hypothetical protein [Rhodospirillum rubrum]|uniref:Amino acid transporter n=1 Tax=Rhodospirillum rubrum (strain ATCC 11170 / ATH 1.1.1 / DSM 467 / LMG 4362 / NCIMB 8255 / S1) TaxID=269796 RepID=Q2RQU4_RHORT|nr:hypothetical protein [Rhodospirillum rubrum]ABC23501.1 hypothetical protein Rru_A2704 [Rhodospirillum rubrum ATCC 11170]AEO49239.1 hypothetical protein F11_13885 [Rhodospirillum rubrum F11]QXG79469.1 hypothetical protein KUL73_13960 [Rhodospirillum rubrum]